MRTTKVTRHHRDSGHQHGQPAGSAGMYYGWSHDEGRMRMMDLPSYLDSFRLGYERALEDLQGQVANLTAMMPAGSPASPWQLYQAPGAQPGSPRARSRSPSPRR